MKKAICIKIFIFVYGALYGQGVELDMFFGASTVKSHYISEHELETFPNSGNEDLGNSQIGLGISTPIYKGFYLRTELGFINIRTSNQFRIDYEDIVGNPIFEIFQGNLLIQKYYLGILPEYRFHLGILHGMIHGGVLIGDDYHVTNTSNNTTYFVSEYQSGFKIGGRVELDLGNIGFGIGISYNEIGDTIIPLIAYPRIKLGLMFYNLSMRYSLYSDKDTDIEKQTVE